MGVNNIKLPQDYIIFRDDPEYSMSTRQKEDYEKWSKFLQLGRQNPCWFVEEVFGIELLDYQRYIMMNSWTTPYNVWCCSRSSGKALALDTKIPLPEGGYTTIEKLKEGDYVIGDDGKPTKILYTSEVFHGHDCYEITFSDGEKIVADANHIWSVRKKIKSRKVKGAFAEKELTTEQLSKKYKKERSDGKFESIYHLKINKPVQYSTKEQLIHPYVLGLWLGDGSRNTGYITSGKNDYIEMISLIESVGWHVTSIINDGCNNKRLTIGAPDGTPLITLLKQIGLINNKDIPDNYLYGDVDQRKELLKGLMDTDGSCSFSKKGGCEFTQKSKEFIDKFSQLLFSLGIPNGVAQHETKVSKDSDKYFTSYRCYFYIDKQNTCFKFKKKKGERVPETINVKTRRKYIREIKQVESVPTKCIYVDNESHLFLCGEKFTVTHNTTMGAIYIMAKTILVPGFKTYILCNSGQQSVEMFTKLEQIATKAIPSFKSLTDVFVNELVKSQANTNGFVHNPASYTCRTYNNSQVFTLNGCFDNNRGKRASLVFFDEAAFCSDDIFISGEPFVTQNSSFFLSKDMDVEDMKTQPKQFPNQLIYASSAGATDQYFFRKYREASLHMDAGDKRYFCIDLPSDAVMNATRRGEKLPEALLTQETIDAAMRENKEKAMREYKNIFTSEGGEGQIIRRSDIIRNSYPRLPLLCNPDNKSLFAIAYDPARSHDNSAVAVGQFYEDPNVGWKMRIVNVTTFADIFKKNKTPMSTPNQIEAFKRMIIAFNGKQVADYENILSILVDAGSGGAGVPITDFLCEDFTVDNVTHRGLIDVNYNENDGKKFPNAVKDKLKLVSPAKYKSELYESLIQMMDSNLIEFTEEYNDKGYITLIFEKNTKTGELKQRFTYPSEEEEEKLRKQGIIIVTDMRKLDKDEELALKQIDLAKTELVNMYRFKQSSGKDRFDLAPDKANKLHDDRALKVSAL